MPHEATRKLLAQTPAVVLLLAALALVAAQVQRPELLLRIGVPWAEVGALAMVMTAIIITGGIDLSVASIAVLAMMVEGVLWRDAGLPIEAAALCGLLAATAAGALNGGLVVLGLSPLVATLATMALYWGLAMTLCDARPVADIPEPFQAWGQVAALPVQYWLLVLVGAVMFIVLHHTRWGRYCYAIGDNRTAARFAAVRVRRIEGALYAASGLVAGMVGVLYTVREGAAIPDAQRGVELQAIACVVVGGTRITGGAGGVLRTLLGLAAVAGLDVGLMFLGARIDWLTAEARLIVLGALLIVVAVWSQRIAPSSAPSV